MPRRKGVGQGVPAFLEGLGFPRLGKFGHVGLGVAVKGLGSRVIPWDVGVHALFGLRRLGCGMGARRTGVPRGGHVGQRAC